MELNNHQTFTKFPNELLENIMCSKLKATEIKVLLCVARYTYGFHREQHQLSVSFIQKATDLSYHNVQKAVQHLIEKSILIETRRYTPTTPRCIAINPDFHSIFEQNYGSTHSNTSTDISISVKPTQTPIQVPTQNIVVSVKETQSDTQTNTQSYGGIHSNTTTDIELIPTSSVQLDTSCRITADTQERNLEIKNLKKEVKERHSCQPRGI